MRGIENLRQRKLPLKLKTVATSINKHEVYAMKRLRKRIWFGIQVRRTSQSPPRLLAESLSVRLSPEDVVALDLHAQRNRDEYRHLAERDLASPPTLEAYDSSIFARRQDLVCHQSFTAK